MSLIQKHCNEDDKLKISYYTIYVGMPELSFLLHKVDFNAPFFFTKSLFEFYLFLIVGVSFRPSPFILNSLRTTAIVKRSIQLSSEFINFSFELSLFGSVKQQKTRTKTVLLQIRTLLLWT